MRDELAKVIQARAGLDEATAQQVAGVAIDYLKTRLPPALAPFLDAEVPDLGSLTQGFGGLGGGLGGLFGQRSEERPQ